jgi:hypothetical protein
MNTRLKIIGSMAAFAAASSAYGFHFNPTNATVKMTGTYVAIVNGFYERCEIPATIRTNQAGTDAKMTSFIPSGCAVGAVGLPWKLKANSLNQVTIKDFAYSETEGTCGPVGLRFAVDRSGIWSVNKKFKGPQKACGLVGNWTSTPPLTVVP